MKLVFEKSVKGRYCSVVPKSDVKSRELPSSFLRKSSLDLPELSEIDISRHYAELAKQVHGVNDGFYPLGSCTMKYNPAVHEELAGLNGFTGVHPLQDVETAQGSMEALFDAEKLICDVTGMDVVTFQPAAGAHGEFAGLLMIKAYHEANGNFNKTKIIVPDSAHGTNPATTVMTGFTVVNVPSYEDGSVNVEKLREAVDEDTAGLMLTNPNTLGIFDKNILEITEIIHSAGGLNYYDGANLNAIMGIVRPGDMGFDVIHLNLHKTMATPHGGGGPGSGSVGAKNILKPYLPLCHPIKTDEGFVFDNAEKSIGRVKNFYGNFAVSLRALLYMKTLGMKGLREASEIAVLNANYMKYRLEPHCKIAHEGFCMHEFVLSLEDIKKETGVTALDIAKSMLDYKMHPPTMYFPLIVKEALMFEPTETESKETLDFACDTVISLLKKAYENPEELKSSPLTTPIGRPDEVLAARKPKLRYENA